MKRTLLILMLVVVSSSPAFALAPTPFWSRTYGDGMSQFGRAVAIDPNGNSYFAGDFQGTVNFGGSNLVSLGGNDMYFVKFDVFGNHLWSKAFGSTGEQHAMSLAIDPSGNVYMGGYFANTMNLGDGLAITSAGGNDIFIAKYDSGGNLIWKARRGDAQNQMLQTVATDSFGNVCFAGGFSGTLSLGGTDLVGAGGLDMYVAEYSPTGAWLWSKRFGDASDQTVASIAVDTSDNVLLLGDFAGTVNFGTGNMTSVGATSIGLAKFNTSGVCQWSRQYGTGSTTFSRAVTTDSSGNVYIAGQFLCCIDFGGGNHTETGGNFDVFLAKLDPLGTYIWSKDFGDNNVQNISAIATDYKDGVYLYGQFNGQIDFGGGSVVGTPGAVAEPYLARLDASGAHDLSVFFPGGPVSTRGLASHLDDVCITGAFAGTINFGGGVMATAGMNDVYMARFGRFGPKPVMVSIVDVGHDQGGKVWIDVARSSLDGPVSTPIDHYEFYRKQEPTARSAAAEAPGRVAVNGWDLVGSIPAHGEDDYLAIAPTLADSTIADGQHYSTYFARAITANPLVYFDSPPDSGYSLDNLAPGVPANFVYHAGVLSWSHSTTADFDHFTAYGSNTNSFVSATAINNTATTSMDVSLSPYAFYFVTATDASGNEGKPASLMTPTAVDGTPKSYVLSLSAYPNPFNPRTTIRYTLPSKGRINVAIYDAAGSRVATLFNGEQAAGAFTREWSGRDDAGRTVSSGVYFARITHSSGTRSYKLIMIK